MRMPYEYEMMHEDFVVGRKWVRGLAVFYGCVGVGIIVLALTGGLVPSGSKNAVVRGPSIDVPARPITQNMVQSEISARGR